MQAQLPVAICLRLSSIVSLESLEALVCFLLLLLLEQCLGHPPASKHRRRRRRQALCLMLGVTVLLRLRWRLQLLRRQMPKPLRHIRGLRLRPRQQALLSLRLLRLPGTFRQPNGGTKSLVVEIVVEIVVLLKTLAEAVPGDGRPSGTSST